MPNKLDEIKDKEKKTPSVYLEDVDITAIAMTSGAGACSQMNEPYILKSKDFNLTQDQIDILKEVGEYEELLNNIKKQKEEELMDAEIKKELEDQKKINEDLQKKLDDITAMYEAEALAKSIMTVQKSLDIFEIEEDLKKSVAEIMVGLEDSQKETLIKAFTVLKDFKEKEDGNDIQTLCSTEVGAVGEVDKVEKSFVERIKEYNKK